MCQRLPRGLRGRHGAEGGERGGDIVTLVAEAAVGALAVARAAAVEAEHGKARARDLGGEAR